MIETYFSVLLTVCIGKYFSLQKEQIMLQASEIEKNILKFIVSMCSGQNIIIAQRITSQRTII